MSVRLSAIPGLPPLLACFGLLALWEMAARVAGIAGLPPAHAALSELPAIPRRYSISCIQSAG